VFPSVLALQEAINGFVAAHNRDPEPFVWKAEPEAIIAAASRRYQAHRLQSSPLVFTDVILDPSPSEATHVPDKVGPNRDGLTRISHRGSVHRGSEPGIILLPQRLKLAQRSSPMPTQCSRDLFGYEVVEGR
jgi:hypothetical protein